MCNLRFKKKLTPARRTLCAIEMTKKTTLLLLKISCLTLVLLQVQCGNKFCMPTIIVMLLDIRNIFEGSLTSLFYFFGLAMLIISLIPDLKRHHKFLFVISFLSLTTTNVIYQIYYQTNKEWIGENYNLFTTIPFTIIGMISIFMLLKKPYDKNTSA